MAESTDIAWCDSTINLWIGCTQISPACDDCYAMAWAARFKIPWNAPPRRTADTSWKKIESYQRHADLFRSIHGRRRRVFINSLSDFFDNQADPAWRKEACWRMKDAKDVTFILVTKRPQNVLKLAPMWWMYGGWPENVWLLTTVENQVEADRRIPLLIDAAKRLGIRTIGLSMEPLLERIRIGTERLACLNWIIFGGESGKNARPMSNFWVESLLDLAMAIEREDGNPRPAVFVKQLYQRGPKDKAFKDFATFPPSLQHREFPGE